jgi:hypothetical protein
MRELCRWLSLFDIEWIHNIDGYTFDFEIPHIFFDRPAEKAFDHYWLVQWQMNFWIQFYIYFPIPFFWFIEQ